MGNFEYRILKHRFLLNAFIIPSCIVRAKNLVAIKSTLILILLIAHFQLESYLNSVIFDTSMPVGFTFNVNAHLKLMENLLFGKIIKMSLCLQSNMHFPRDRVDSWKWGNDKF